MEDAFRIMGYIEACQFDFGSHWDFFWLYHPGLYTPKDWVMAVGSSLNLPKRMQFHCEGQ